MHHTNLAGRWAGGLHLANSLIEAVLWLIVLSLRKVTRNHRKIGYARVGAMFAFNLTSLLNF